MKYLLLLKLMYCILQVETEVKMKQFGLNKRNVLLPDDAVLEWRIEGGVFRCSPKGPGSSGLLCYKNWHEKSVNAMYFKIKVWISHANLNKTLEHEFVVAFEDMNSTAGFEVIDYSKSREFTEPHTAKVEAAVIECFNLRDLSYFTVIKTVKYICLEEPLLKGLEVSCSDAGSYMTSVD
jgi:hypothetical protein